MCNVIFLEQIFKNWYLKSIESGTGIEVEVSVSNNFEQYPAHVSDFIKIHPNMDQNVGELLGLNTMLPGTARKTWLISWFYLWGWGTGDLSLTCCWKPWTLLTQLSATWLSLSTCRRDKTHDWKHTLSQLIFANKQHNKQSKCTSCSTIHFRIKRVWSHDFVVFKLPVLFFFFLIIGFKMCGRTDTIHWKYVFGDDWCHFRQNWELC